MNQIRDLYDFVLEVEGHYKNLDAMWVLGEAVRGAKPQHACELGAAWGCSAVIIARALPPGSRLTIVDDWRLRVDGQPTPSPEIVRRNLTRFGVSVCSDIVTSDTRAPFEPPYRAPIDFVFFDASHDEDDLLAEYRAVLPKLALRRTLVIDDAVCVPNTIKHIAAAEGLPVTLLPAHHQVAIIGAR